MESVHLKAADGDMHRQRLMRNDFSSVQIVRSELFNNCMRSVIGKELPHDVFYCSFGRLTGSSLSPLKLLHRNFPLEYFFELAQPDGSFYSPLVNQWYATRRPVYFQSGRDDARFPAGWVGTFKKYGLHNMVAHGKSDVASGFFSSFSFYRLPGEVGEQHAALMELLVPHLHDALLTALGPELLGECAQASVLAPLSAVQKRVFYWMRQGKTDWETSKILGINERTVKYHVKRIMTKLGAVNRTHAVAKANACLPLVQLR